MIRTLRITAVREDEVPGTHIITWDSSSITLKLSHEAKSRRGLALGAVLAAEFIRIRKGYIQCTILIQAVKWLKIA